MLTTWTLLALVTLGAPAVPARAPVDRSNLAPEHFTYKDQRGRLLQVTFNNDVQTVTVTLPGGKPVTLKPDPASSVRYVKGKRAFTSHQSQCTYTDGDTVLFKGWDVRGLQEP